MSGIYDYRVNLLKIMVLLNKINKLKKVREGISGRRYWVKPLLKTRSVYGAYRTIFIYFKENDHPEFQKLTRMSVQQFDLLHSLIKRKISKNNTLRETLSSELRLAAVLTYVFS